MARKYFGTDGIRGTVGSLPITPDFVLKLAYAVGCVLKKTEQKSVILIGKDTRISGYMLESAMESGFNSAGVDVVLLGPIPTPAVAYLTRAQRASLGVVISASHNPYPDNGIKFFDSNGRKLSDAWESNIEQMMDVQPEWCSADALGKSRRLDDASGRYIEFCKSTFSPMLTLRGLKLVVDAAHGAAYQIAPAVFHELGADVVTIGCEPDGYNINAQVGATSPNALIQKVLASQADIGIALDGDADRVLLVDASGRIFNGDELLYLLLKGYLQRGVVVQGVAGTLMTNMAIENAIKAMGVEFVRTKVGDRYVLEALEEKQWLLGGEGSGHLLMLDKQTTGDGIVSALQILQLCVQSNSALSDLLKNIQLFPQTLINVRLKPSENWQRNEQLFKQTQEVEKILGHEGRVLIRASGTEPLLRIMVEAKNPVLAKELAEKLAETLN